MTIDVAMMQIRCDLKGRWRGYVVSRCAKPVCSSLGAYRRFVLTSKYYEAYILKRGRMDRPIYLVPYDSFGRE